MCDHFADKACYANTLFTTSLCYHYHPSIFFPNLQHLGTYTSLKSICFLTICDVELSILYIGSSCVAGYRVSET